MDSDILIVGAGIFGVSTAYHLSKSLKHSSSKITLLDRAPAPSTDAASTDINKIIRADYTSPFFMNLAYEAMDAWSTWPEFHPSSSSIDDDTTGKRSVYTRTGWALIDDKGSDRASRFRANFRTSGREDHTADITVEEMKSRWGGLLNQMETEGGTNGYVNPDTGWVDASRAVEIMVAEAVGRGVRYEVGEVERIVLADGKIGGGGGGVHGVKVADGRVYKARKILLATGAWTSQLMTTLEDELEIEEDDRVEKQVCAAACCCAHVQLTPEEFEAYRHLPVLVCGSDGEIIPPTPSGILKFTDAGTLKNTVTTLTGHKITAPPPSTKNHNQTTIPAKLQSEMKHLVRKRFPSLLSADRGVAYYRLCWDSITPTQQQLITGHPDTERLGNLYFAVGGSFHSWKFLPTIGRYVVNVLDGVGNGEEKDGVWAWKGKNAGGRGVHEDVVPRRELGDME